MWIQSDPGNRTFPVSSSAMMHPTDQISAADREAHVEGEREREDKIQWEKFCSKLEETFMNWAKKIFLLPCPQNFGPSHKILHREKLEPLVVSPFTAARRERKARETFLGIVHPVQHDLWSSPVASGYVTSHNLCSGSAQSEVQDLDFAIFAHANVTGFQIL